MKPILDKLLYRLKSKRNFSHVLKGFLLTLEMDGQTYQHYYPGTVVLCVSIGEKVCDAAFKKANPR